MFANFYELLKNSVRHCWLLTVTNLKLERGGKGRDDKTAANFSRLLAPGERKRLEVLVGGGGEGAQFISVSNEGVFL